MLLISLIYREDIIEVFPETPSKLGINFYVISIMKVVYHGNTAWCNLYYILIIEFKSSYEYCKRRHCLIKKFFF